MAPDPLLLFRFSALTFNGHRIRYDLKFATEDEGYPGLVAHGPLLATLMAELVRRARPQARVTRFRFRAERPVFDTAPFTVAGAPAPGGKGATPAVAGSRWNDAAGLDRGGVEKSASNAHVWSCLGSKFDALKAQSRHECRLSGRQRPLFRCGD